MVLDNTLQKKRIGDNADKLMEEVFGENPNESVASTLEEQYKENEGVVTTTFEEDLRNAINPFVLSNKYSKNELRIIEKRLTNTILEQREASNLSSEPTTVIEKNKPLQNILNKIFKPKTSNNITVDWAEKTYIPYNSKYIQLDHDFGNVRIYRDDIYGLSKNDNDFDESRRYIEINGTRRTETGKGDYVYELYNLTDNLLEDGTAYRGVTKGVELNLEKASKEQIEEFEDNLYKFELDNAINKITEDKTQIEFFKQQLKLGEIDIKQFDLLVGAIKREDEPWNDPFLTASTANLESPVNLEVLVADKMMSIVGVDGGKEDPIIRAKLEEALKEILKGGTLTRDVDLPDSIVKKVKKRFGIDLRAEGDNVDWSKWLSFIGIDEEYYESGQVSPIYRTHRDDYDVEDFMTVQTVIEEEAVMKALLGEIKTTSLKTLQSFDKKHKEILEGINDKVSLEAEMNFVLKYFIKKSLKIGGEDYNASWMLKGEYLDKKDEIAKEYKDMTGMDIEWGDQFFGRDLRIEDVDDYGNPLGIIDPSYFVDESMLQNYFMSAIEKEKTNHPKLNEVAVNLDKAYKELKKEVVKKLEPKYRVLNETTQNFIDDHLEQSGFKNMKPINQARVMDNVWLGIEEYLYSLSGSEKKNLIEEMGVKTEGYTSFGAFEAVVERHRQDYYYNMYARHLAWSESNDTSKRMWSTFAIKDYARNILSAESDIMDRLDELQKTSKGRNSQEYKNLFKMIEFARDVIESPHKIDGNFAQNFFNGFTSGKWEDYMPFVNGLKGIWDATDIKAAADRLADGNPGPGDEILLTMYSLNSTIESRINEMGGGFNGYNIGQISGIMMSYIPEFIATGIGFSGTRKFATRQLNKISVKGVKLGNTKIGKFSSWMIGTAGHASLNPQHYIRSTIENMTPQFVEIMSTKDMSVTYTMLNLNQDELSKKSTSFKDGKLYSLPGFKGKRKFSVGYVGEGDAFAKAFFKGFGITWAEMATERVGEFIPGLGKIGKGIWKIVPKGTKKETVEQFMQACVMSKFMQKMGFNKISEANAYIRKMGFTWDGIIQEIGEEALNQPLSSMIMGRSWDEGFKNPNTGKWDMKFFKEVGGSVVAMQLAFGGANIVRMKLNDKRYYKQYKEEEIKVEEEVNKNNFEVDIEIYNDLTTKMIEAKNKNNKKLYDNLNKQRSEIEKRLNKYTNN